MINTVYITGSFPRLGDGIGDAAGRLYDAIEDKTRIKLITSDDSKIIEYVLERGYDNVSFVPNWKAETIISLIKYICNHNIQNVLIEYAGNGYKKDFAISFLPFVIRIHNLFSRNKIICHLRLHEFSKCRLARKLLTYPLVWFSHHIDTPSYVEYKILASAYGSKIRKSMIGSNFEWRSTTRLIKYNKDNKIVLAFFGAIYPGKGIEKLIDLWGKLHSRYPDKYEYWLLGGFPSGLTRAFDSYQKQILELIKEKGMEKNIQIFGFLPYNEIENLLDRTDIAVLPYEDGLTLRRGSFLAFLGRHVAIVTSMGDREAKEVFKNAIGVKMCIDEEEMISGIIDYSKEWKFLSAGADNERFKEFFDWRKIAKDVMGNFE